MGSIIQTAILPVSPDAVDDAREIGALSVQPTVTAMRIEKGKPDGTLVYTEEAPILTGWQSRVEKYGEKSRHQWWRWETKVSSKTTPSIRPGHHLIIAMHPYSSSWVQQVPFRPTSKKERPELVFASPEELIQWIEKECSYDFWEKGNYLTAGISIPEGPFNFHADIKNRHGDAKWVFGVCDDPIAYGDALWASEEVKKFLNMTEKGTLRFWPAHVPWSTSPSKWKPHLYEKLKAEADSLMWLSIRQALAGPHEDNEDWLGRPVADNLERIYYDHLCVKWKQICRDAYPLMPIESLEAESMRKWEEKERIKAILAQHGTTK
jgi:hypothetical protein